MNHVISPSLFSKLESESQWQTLSLSLSVADWETMANHRSSRTGLIWSFSFSFRVLASAITVVLLLFFTFSFFFTSHSHSATDLHHFVSDTFSLSLSHSRFYIFFSRETNRNWTLLSDELKFEMSAIDSRNRVQCVCLRILAFFSLVCFNFTFCVSFLS